MANTHLIRTISTPSTNSSYTLSMWFKLNQVDIVSSPYIWSHGGTASSTGIYFGADNKLKIYSSIQAISGTTLSDGALRDCNGWYHFVFSVNSGTGTTYINGVQQSGTATNIPALNGGTGDRTAINAYSTTADIDTYDILDISFSHIHFIDGTAYDASAFGEFDANGVWKIKTSPSVTYGNIGYFIFKDGTNLSGSTVQDQSGNGNNFTVAGGTGSITQTEDNPSNVFATLNPLADNGMGGTFNYGNNQVQSQTSNRGFAIATLGASSGKYYWEIKTSATGGTNPADEWNYIGIATRPDAGSDNILGNSGTNSNKLYEYALYAPDGGVYNNGSKTAYGASFTQGDILSFALDLDNSRCYVAKNGQWCDSGAWSASTPTTYFSITSASSTPDGFYFPAFGDGGSNVNKTWQANFGNGYFGTTAVSSAGTNASGIGIFEYDVPTGYTALSTKGLNL